MYLCFRGRAGRIKFSHHKISAGGTWEIDKHDKVHKERDTADVPRFQTGG